MIFGLLGTAFGKAGGGAGAGVPAIPPSPFGWNQADGSDGFTLSNGNLTAVDSQQMVKVMIAVDITNKLVWGFNPVSMLWNSSATANPATGVGGASYTFTGSIYPAISLYATFTAQFTAAFKASSLIYPIPSGFSAWDTLAGSATTWNPSDHGTNITLSNANLTANKTSDVSWTTARATNPLASGKAVFECNIDLNNSGALMAGVCNASATLASYLGSDGNGIAWEQQGNAWGTTTNIGNYDFQTAPHWRGIRNGTSKNAGKKVFEITYSTIDPADTGHTIIAGIMDANAASPAGYPGADAHGWGAQSGSGTVYNAGSGLNNVGTFGAGTTLMFAVDFTALKLWIYNPVNGLWNNGAIGAQNPATGLGGFSIAGFTGTAVFSALGFEEYGSLSKAIGNWGATAFSNAVPSGFSAWNV